MEKTLTEICDYLNNYFVRIRFEGNFKITNGTLTLAGLQAGQYFRILGSVFNDGIYKYPASGLTNEVFTGAVWAMAVPPTVVALAADVDAWKELYAGATSPAMSPFTSENFGNYGYSKGSNNSGGSVNGNTWQGAFAARLQPYRKLRNIL